MNEETELANQYRNKLSERAALLEQINQLDQYFCNIGIGYKGEFMRYLLENEELLKNSNFMKNIQVALQHQNSSIFNKLAEKLNCNTIDQYCKFTLSDSELEGFCDTYMSLPHDEKTLDYPRDENGSIKLGDKDYLTANRAFSGNCEGNWYLLSNGTEVFIKKVHSTHEAYAELVAEQIAKQMGIPHAQYDFVNIAGKTKIASINILEEGEELLLGSSLLTDLKVKDIDSICRIFCRCMRDKYPNLTEDDIQNIKEDFLKITIFDKVIANWDRNPGNWGIIVSADGRIRMAPELDNNKSLDLNGYYDNYHRDMHLNDDHSLETLLEYCYNNFSNPDMLLEFIENCMKNIDGRKACQEIQREKGISIPNEEVMNIDGLVHSKGKQQMRRWLERKRTTPGEEPRL